MMSCMFPGQGSQFVGMGQELFHSPHYPNTLERQIDDLLGYSLRDMCLNGTEEQLRNTAVTQPCLYITNALHYLKFKAESRKPDFLAGHSLGEYNALFAAGSFDILTGLRLVIRRGQLMAAAPPGGMAAVLGLEAESVEQVLKAHNLTSLDLANFNTPKQIVIAGPEEDIQRAEAAFMSSGAAVYIQIPVGAPFHSRYMDRVAQEFSDFISDIEFKPLNCPVISNVTARPYPMEGGQSTRDLLVRQIRSQVLWSPSIGYIKAKGVEVFVEAGPGTVLSRMLLQIPSAQLDEEVLNSGVELSDGNTPAGIIRVPTCESQGEGHDSKVAEVEGSGLTRHETLSPFREPAGIYVESNARDASLVTKGISIDAETLGSESFRKTYGVRYAYVAGAMFKGIASKELVVAMGKQRLLSFFGTGGLKLEAIEEAIRYIQGAIPEGPYGMNLLHHPGDLESEERIVDCYLKHGIKNVEAAAYMSLTPALVRYRVSGLDVATEGGCIRRHRVLAKISRPEVAALFMRPAPEAMVQRLLSAGKITREQAELSRTVPMADDICIEADSGGHTDGGVALTLFPDMLLLRDEISREYEKPPCIRVGAAGGIGTPHAAAAAFTMGADFILTGSINQCTVEAGTSESVKELLESMDVQDTAYAPAGDMFEYGARIQVARKGLFFHTRANMLYDLYSRYSSLEEIPEGIKSKIENKFFRKKLSDVWEETRLYFGDSTLHNISEIERNPKQKMAYTFKWYFAHSNRLALEGDEARKVDYQIQCGPALGAFNRWVKGTLLQSWRNRHVADVAERLMVGTAEFLTERMNSYSNNVSEPKESLVGMNKPGQDIEVRYHQ